MTTHFKFKPATITDESVVTDEITAFVTLASVSFINKLSPAQKVHVLSLDNPLNYTAAFGATPNSDITLYLKISKLIAQDLAENKYKLDEKEDYKTSNYVTTLSKFAHIDGPSIDRINILRKFGRDTKAHPIQFGFRNTMLQKSTMIQTENTNTFQIITRQLVEIMIVNGQNQDGNRREKFLEVDQALWHNCFYFMTVDDSQSNFFYDIVGHLAPNSIKFSTIDAALSIWAHAHKESVSLTDRDTHSISWNREDVQKKVYTSCDRYILTITPNITNPSTEFISPIQLVHFAIVTKGQKAEGIQIYFLNQIFVLMTCNASGGTSQSVDNIYVSPAELLTKYNEILNREKILEENTRTTLNLLRQNIWGPKSNEVNIGESFKGSNLFVSHRNLDEFSTPTLAIIGINTRKITKDILVFDLLLNPSDKSTYPASSTRSNASPSPPSSSSSSSSSSYTQSKYMGIMTREKLLGDADNDDVFVVDGNSSSSSNGFDFPFVDTEYAKKKQEEADFLYAQSIAEQYQRDQKNTPLNNPSTTATQNKNKRLSNDVGNPEVANKRRKSDDRTNLYSIQGVHNTDDAFSQFFKFHNKMYKRISEISDSALNSLGYMHYDALVTYFRDRIDQRASYTNGNLFVVLKNDVQTEHIKKYLTIWKNEIHNYAETYKKYVGSEGGDIETIYKKVIFDPFMNAMNVSHE
jgi:hypothetical protein